MTSKGQRALFQPLLHLVKYLIAMLVLLFTVSKVDVF